jgi:hypothetical protein
VGYAVNIFLCGVIDTIYFMVSGVAGEGFFLKIMPAQSDLVKADERAYKS